MREASGLTPTPREPLRTLAVVRVAERQGGVVSWGQLATCGVTRSTVSRWVDRGRLHRVHPGVYAVGHRVLGIEARLRAALLYAGPAAVLSHTSAAWWWGVIAAQPVRIHLSAPGDRASLRDVCVHHPRRLDATHHRSLPVSTLPRTLLDLAAMLPFDQLRRALAEADHRCLFNPTAVHASLRRGQPGSAALRRALDQHCPSLADTLSMLEQRFLALCEATGLPLPEVNRVVAGLKVDALWRRQRVIVELDGHASHAFAAAAEEDRRRELLLRAAGHRVLRYTWQQVTGQPDVIAADLTRELDL
jgi:predicted transcriptional regulator of viral defense system